jgi:hypothetical protein
LHTDYVFKFAILHQDDLVGILYLEIPYRYKFTKKFKIDDWYQCKPYDKYDMNRGQTIMAKVSINYISNCKLSNDAIKNLEEFAQGDIFFCPQKFLMGIF